MTFPKSQSRAIRVTGYNAKGDLTATAADPDVLHFGTLSKFLLCHSVFIEDSDHKVIQVK